MQNHRDNDSISRRLLVSALARIRSEWQESDSSSLLDIEANVGLLLSDLAVALGLNPEEQIEALGEELYHELNDILQYA